MHIIELTWRNRNDFHFVAYCRHCEKKSRWGDGYADTYYQQTVFPHRHCPDCGLDEYGERPTPPAPATLDNLAAETFEEIVHAK